MPRDESGVGLLPTAKVVGRRSQNEAPAGVEHGVRELVELA